MHTESVEFKRCCFCLPLRRGLIGWGYVRLILELLCSIRLIFTTVQLFSRPISYPWEVVFILAMTISLLIDSVFTLLLITAAHKKNAKLLRISYIYNVVWLMLLLGCGAFFTYAVVEMALRRWHYGYYEYVVIDVLSLMGFLYAIIFVQVYVTLLTRSEAAKLRNQRLEVQFVNNAAEGEARCACAAN